MSTTINAHIKGRLTEMADNIRYLTDSVELMTLQEMSIKLNQMREEGWGPPQENSDSSAGGSTDESTEGSMSLADLDKYFGVWEIDFMTALPSESFKYYNPLYDGLNTNIFFMQLFDLTRNVSAYKPAIVYQFDKDGNVAEYPEEERFDPIEVTVEMQTVEDLSAGGQGPVFYFEQNKNYVYTLVIATDQNFQNIIFEKITGKSKLFISYNNMDSGIYFWQVFVTDKSTLLKSQYTIGSFEFTFAEPPTTDNCCPKNLTREYINDLENAEFIINTNMQYYVFYEYYNEEQDYWDYIQKNVSGSEAAWPFFANMNNYYWDGGGCTPYMSNGSYISWTRRDGLKMVADKHIRFRLADCYSNSTFAFEGSENGTVWTEIARIQTNSNDYTHPLTQIAVYTHFRIRALCDTKLRKIEVD